MKTPKFLCFLAWILSIAFTGKLSAQTGTNLLNAYNPGFESGLTGYGGSGFSHASIDLVNPGAGTKSAKLSADPANNWNVLVNTAVTIPVIPGNTYVLSGLTRQNLTGGTASLGLCQLNSSQVPLRYEFQETSNSSTWHTESLTLNPPADTAYLRLYLWVSQSSTAGAAWWDGLRLETFANPFLDDSNASFRVLLPTMVLNYNGSSITPSTLSPVVEFGGGFVGGVVDWKLFKEVDGVNGQPLLQGTYAVQQSGSWQWPIDMSQVAQFGVGRYLLSITAVNADGSDTETIVKPLAVIPTPGSSSLSAITSSKIDGNGMLSVNNQPFQAVMYYMTLPADFAFQRTNLGANSVEVTGNSVAALSASIDQAWNAGLYSWVVLFQPPFVSGSGATTTWNISTLQSGINTLKNKPGVLGWVLYDEPDGHGVPASAVQTAYNAIKAVDLNHVVWVNFTRVSLFDTYTGCSDLASYDIYPFPSLDLSLINTANTAIKAAQPGKPLLSVLQGFGTAGFPSFGQLRAELYTNVCDGMSHLFYFAWYMPQYYSLVNELEMQSYTRLLNWEMSQLRPFLFSTSAPLSATASDPNVRVTAKTVGSNVVLVMVNQSDAPIQNVSATVSGRTFTSHTAYFAGTSAGNLVSGNLVDNLPPYGVGIYQLH